MKNYVGAELVAYGRGIHAAYRIDEYEGNDDPRCLYGRDSKEGEAWRDGFGDGTEDMISANRSD